MASQTTFRIPIVDFSQATGPGTDAWDLARTQIDKAIGEYGCFEVIYPKLSAAECTECQQVFSQLGRLFALPAETKLKNLKETVLSSYVFNQPEYPLYESMVRCGQTVESFADLMWPDGSQGFSGFEFRSKVGEWHRTTHAPTGTILCLIGESFRAWSNSRLYPPLHRAKMTNEERFSVGLFTIPKRGWLVKAPEELVDEEHLFLFKPYEYYDFLDSYSKYRAEDTLSKLAGIRTKMLPSVLDCYDRWHF